MNGIEFAVPQYTTAEEIKKTRQIFKLSQAEFAGLLGCSRPTVERWERSQTHITGLVVLLIDMLQRHPADIIAKIVPDRKTNLRLWYMYKQKPCTLIDVDELHRSVEIRNFTDDIMYCAFGKSTVPDYSEYEAFLESRCFPRDRDKIKLILEELGLPFYDLLMIIEKTEGRMAEDDFWLKVERKKHG